MKILRKPKLMSINCWRCGCVFQPKMRNLSICRVTDIKEEVHCPSCNALTKAIFEIPESEDAPV